MANLSEIFFAEAEECGTVKFGIAPDVVVGVRMERLAVLVAPLFLSLVLGLDIDRTRIHIVFPLWKIVPRFRMRMLRPVEASVCTSVPPPAPVPMMITS